MARGEPAEHGRVAQREPSEGRCTDCAGPCCILTFRPARAGEERGVAPLDHKRFSGARSEQRLFGLCPQTLPLQLRWRCAPSVGCVRRHEQTAHQPVMKTGREARVSHAKAPLRVMALASCTSLRGFSSARSCGREGSAADQPGIVHTESMETQRARRHHYVPQFYLKGFADADNRVVTVRLPGNQRFLQSARKAATEIDFYSIPGHEDGADVFEKLLSKLEAEAARIIARVREGVWPLSVDDRNTLAEFIAVQATRGPELRRTMNSITAMGVRLELGWGGRANAGRWARERLGVELTEEAADALWNSATAPGGPSVRHSAGDHVQQLLSLVSPLRESLRARAWHLVRFDRRALITSDVPVSLAPDPNSDYPGLGFANAQYVLFPLCRRIGLMMRRVEDASDHSAASSGVLDAHREASTVLEKLFNQLTVLSASMAVFHHPEDDRFVPPDLPEPRSHTVGIAGGEPTFDEHGLVEDAN